MENYIHLLEQIKTDYTNDLIFNILICLFIFILMLVSFTIQIRNDRTKEKSKFPKIRIGFKLAVIAAAVLLIVGTVQDFIDITGKINYDIENAEFLVYEGEFTSGGKYRGDPSKLSFNPDNSQNTLTVYAYGYDEDYPESLNVTESGKFEGRIVYAKESLIVVALEELQSRCCQIKILD